MKKLTKIFGGIVAVAALAFAGLVSPLAVQTVGAQCDTSAGVSGGIDCANPGAENAPQDLFGTGSIFTTIVNVLLFIIGAISVIMLIIGGIRYTISNGDSGAVTSAKNTILYAIVGLAIAFFAFAIVNWVLGAITPGA